MNIEERDLWEMGFIESFGFPKEQTHHRQNNKG